MIIEKNDKINQMIDHLKNESIESRFVKSIYQVKKTSFLYIDIKNIYFLTFEMILDRNQNFNANTIDTMFLLQIDLKINEILNFDQNQDVQETSNLNSNIENESQSQSSIKSKKNKQSMIMFADAMIMNIKSRKQTYSIALITIETLKSFHAAVLRVGMVWVELNPTHHNPGRVG
jgi:FtsZ-binding cell division protein ZapB